MENMDGHMVSLLQSCLLFIVFKISILVYLNKSEVLTSIKSQVIYTCFDC